MSITTPSARHTDRPAAWTRFRHGELECTVVSDGPIHLGPARDAFPGAEPAELDELLQRHYQPTEQVSLEQNLLLVEAGGQLVLFDTGVGTNLDLGRGFFGPQTGRAIPNLRAAGVEPADIDIVAITHGHPDHCWGLVDDDHRPLYPNARIAISRTDYEFWTDVSRIHDGMTDHMKDHFTGAHRNLTPYRDRLLLLEDGDQVADGITAIATPGHSPGHLVYSVSSAGQTMLVWGDLCHHQVLLLKRPQWGFVFDHDGPAATAQRLRIYQLADEGRHTVFAYHFPFPGRGHLLRDGDEYTWLPLPLELS
ncbi:MAG TPA: MBL fold metallo-hydrolase [Pseudonocardia sp.]|nr:MBL fold metallo-hydrolase [Pseudonocardia sp.]